MTMKRLIVLMAAVASLCMPDIEARQASLRPTTPPRSFAPLSHHAMGPSGRPWRPGSPPTAASGMMSQVFWC